MWKRVSVEYTLGQKTYYTKVKGRFIYLEKNSVIFFYDLKIKSTFSTCYVIVHGSDVTITGEGLRILTYARHLWLLSNVGSLACHIDCDTEHTFIMVISEDTWHSNLLSSVWQWSCRYLFYRLRSVADGIPTPNVPLTERKL